MTFPVHGPGQATELLFPVVVLGIVTLPQEAVVYTRSAQTGKMQLPEIPDQIPLVHVALIPDPGTHGDGHP